MSVHRSILENVIIFVMSYVQCFGSTRRQMENVFLSFQELNMSEAAGPVDTVAVDELEALQATC